MSALRGGGLASKEATEMIACLSRHRQEGGSKENSKCCGRYLWGGLRPLVFIIATITGLRVGIEWPLRLEGRIMTKGQPNHQQSTHCHFDAASPHLQVVCFAGCHFEKRRMRRMAATDARTPRTDWPPVLFRDVSFVEAPNLSSTLPMRPRPPDRERGTGEGM